MEVRFYHKQLLVIALSFCVMIFSQVDFQFTSEVNRLHAFERGDEYQRQHEKQAYEDNSISLNFQFVESMSSVIFLTTSIFLLLVGPIIEHSKSADYIIFGFTMSIVLIKFITGALMLHNSVGDSYNYSKSKTGLSL